MTDREPVDAGRVQDVILRSLFDDVRPSQSPTFVLLAGASGAGAGRAVAQLRREHDGALVPITIEDMQAFHPRYVGRQFRDSPEGQQELSRLAAGWLQAGITHARENRFSLLLEGAFRSPETTLSVARRFADTGYDVRVVAVAARDDESLLTTTSRGLRRMQSGQAAQFVTPAENAQSVREVSALIVAATDDTNIDRVSVFGPRGESIFDARRSSSGMLNGAFAALNDALSKPLSALDAAQWLSELRRMTEYTRSLTSAPPSAAVESLIELHEMAARRVVPELPLPPGSEVVRIQQAKLAADAAALRRMQVRPEVVDAAAPAVVPMESAPSISR